MCGIICSVCFSPDGRMVLAGGNSRFVCLYAVAQRLLLKKFQVSHNRALEGVIDYLDTRNLSEGGPLELIDHTDSESSDDEDDNREESRRQSISLPGVQSGYYSQRRVRPAIRTRSVRYSPTGRQWACCTTEGLLLYSLDETLLFDPFQLNIDITPDTILHTLQQHLYLKALIVTQSIHFLFFDLI